MQCRYPTRICSQSAVVSPKIADSASAIGNARLVNRLACSICTKATASRKASRTCRRIAALQGKRLNSVIWASSWRWASATFASGTCSSHALQLSTSLKSGAASAEIWERSKSVSVISLSSVEQLGKLGRNRGVAYFGTAGGRRAACRPPRGVGKMRIIGAARNHVPVDVRYLVAETGKVHLVGLEQAPQGRF